MKEFPDVPPEDVPADDVQPAGPAAADPHPPGAPPDPPAGAVGRPGGAPGPGRRDRTARHPALAREAEAGQRVLIPEMTMPYREEQAQDVAAASAAYLIDILPELLQLSPPEQFRRLADHFETSILAYCDAVRGFAPELSRN